ncbi:hypothetical protein KJ780_04880 [Candidatus Micrarchaeota archaeon]|nr:hypothetical protein [Candidatus Micrarchaeota archaeon]
MKKLLSLMIFLMLFGIIFAPPPAPVVSEEEVNIPTKDPSDIEDPTAALKDQIKEPGFMDIDISTPDMQKELLNNTFISILIVIFIIVILYMAGNFLQIPNLIAMAKDESYQVILTVILAVFFLSYVYGTDVPLIKQAIGIDVFDSATFYSYNVLYKITELFSVFVTFNVYLNIFHSLFLPLGPIRQALTIQLGPALKPLIDLVSFNLQYLILAYGEWTIFIFIFGFIKKWFIPFFLPLGLLMRTFTHTRGGGNALIGLAIALSTIYPLMFHISGIIFDKEFPDLGTFDYVKQGMVSLVSVLSATGVLGLFAALSVIFVSAFWVAGILLIARLAIDTSIDAITIVVVFSLLLPFINIFMTLTFAREISKLLGTEINLGAFVKLI